MKKLKKSRIFLIISLVSALTFSVPVAAYAGYAYGNTLMLYITYQYQTRNFVYTGSHFAAAYTDIGSTTSVIPIGYEGAQAWLYTSGGGVIGYSSWYYNASAMAVNHMYLVNYEYYNAPSGYSYYSQGDIAIWDKSISKYHTGYWPYRSPNQTVS